MFNNSKFMLYRGLVTDLLPYEVPVTFTNDKFYRLIAGAYKDESFRKLINKILDCKQSSFYIPYNYEIKKDSSRSTTLSIPHPLWQQEASLFLSTYEQTILLLCTKSSFSLRKPVAVTEIYTRKKLDRENSIKTGIVHDSEELGIFAASNIKSYFKYSPFTLMAKFYESHAFTKMERKYKNIRYLDVSKCFYHIYTHSIAWAVKGKYFAKENSRAYSFENKFDKLMQQVNHNETNGIIVGPEISRIFAEIIFQDIDEKCEFALSEQGLKHETDYVIRRYVDDFCICANKEEHLNLIESIVRRELEKYKLFVNEKKVFTINRPFITPLSIARKELRMVLNDMATVIDSMAKKVLPPEDKFTNTRTLRNAVADVRAIICKNKIEVSSISGWFLSAVRKLILRAKDNIDLGIEGNTQVWYKIITSILEVVFHVCALDLRPRTTYSLCHIVFSIKKFEGATPSDVSESINSRTYCFISDLIKNAVLENPERINDIDIHNLLIMGSYFFGDYFFDDCFVQEALNKLSINDFRVNYFNVIVLEFCLLQRKSFGASLRESLHKNIHEFLLSDKFDNKKSDNYMLLLDYIGMPDVEAGKKRAVLEKLYGGKVSKAEVEKLTKISGFTEWDALKIEHLLKRKELRPTYARA